MKKTLITIFAAALLAFCAYGQEAETQDHELTHNENTADSSSFRGGVSADMGFCFGTLSEYIWLNMGLGTAAEYDIPLALPGILNAGSLCASVRSTFSYDPPKSVVIDHMWNLRFIASASYRLPLFNTGFILQPELGYGIVFNFPHADETYGNELKKCYADQMFQLALSARYSSPLLLNGKIELEFCPTISVSPEKNNGVHYIGFRIGALYKIW